MGWARQKLPKRFSSLAFGGHATAQNPRTHRQGTVTSILQTSCWRGGVARLQSESLCKGSIDSPFTQTDLNQEKHQRKLHWSKTSSGEKSDRRMSEKNKELIFLIVFLNKSWHWFVGVCEQRLYILKNSLIPQASTQAMLGNKAHRVSHPLEE